MLYRWHKIWAQRTTMEGCAGASGGLAVASPSLLLLLSWGSAGRAGGRGSGRAGWAHPGRQLPEGLSAPAQLLRVFRQETGAFWQRLSHSSHAFGGELSVSELGPAAPGKAAPCAAPGSRCRKGCCYLELAHLSSPARNTWHCVGQLSSRGWGYAVQRKEAELGARRLPDRRQRWGCERTRSWGRADERGPWKPQLCNAGPVGSFSTDGWGQAPACKPLRKHHCLFLEAGESVFQL